MKPAVPLLLALALLFGGCATFDAQVERSRSLAGVQRFFVVSNLNDNHALDRHIAAALKARGCEAETGPLTMMPDETQAIVEYQDRWAWDFGDHLVFLAINVRDARKHGPLGSATFHAKIPLREPASVTAGRLVDRLFGKN